MPTAQKTRLTKRGTIVDLCGVRTLLDAPLLKKGELIGTIALYRQEVRRFTDQQVELVRNFAAQAVIAIENTRLLNELRQSLEEQTATSEVLQVISSSPGDLEPVFAAMLEKAVRICDAKFGNIYRWDGEMLVLVATQNTPPEFAEVRRSRLLRHTPNDPVGRMIGTKSLVHTADLSKEPEYIERSNPALIAAVEVGGVRRGLQGGMDHSLPRRLSAMSRSGHTSTLDLISYCCVRHPFKTAPRGTKPVSR